MPSPDQLSPWTALPSTPQHSIAFTLEEPSSPQHSIAFTLEEPSSPQHSLTLEPRAFTKSLEPSFLQPLPEREHQVLVDLRGREQNATGDLSGREHRALGDLSGREQKALGEISGREKKVLSDLSGREPKILVDRSGDKKQPGLVLRPGETEQVEVGDQGGITRGQTAEEDMGVEELLSLPQSLAALPPSYSARRAVVSGRCWRCWRDLSSLEFRWGQAGREVTLGPGRGQGTGTGSGLEALHTFISQ